jgi:hypothetical protein
MATVGPKYFDPSESKLDFGASGAALGASTSRLYRSGDLGDSSNSLDDVHGAVVTRLGGGASTLSMSRLAAAELFPYSSTAHEAATKIQRAWRWLIARRRRLTIVLQVCGKCVRALLCSLHLSIPPSLHPSISPSLLPSLPSSIGLSIYLSAPVSHCALPPSLTLQHGLARCVCVCCQSLWRGRKIRRVFRMLYMRATAAAVRIQAMARGNAVRRYIAYHKVGDGSIV